MVVVPVYAAVAVSAAADALQTLEQEPEPSQDHSNSFPSAQTASHVSAVAAKRASTASAVQSPHHPLFAQNSTSGSEQPFAERERVPEEQEQNQEPAPTATNSIVS